ncbi:lysis system i-spanin subunit Rz [Pseudomonas sp. MRSN 12121]|uniref:lysis system i-spanin subunit Rz n=1 Tax=Pseudomonas sp. MRSN 12121 TaxID=1611770 RepID=UPI0005BEDBCB|nr:lysis system i-spanin subunit Rz [Pseudomonas sp. MRSN 12121]AJO81037.1 lysis protein [Pseudomonas sp. MRSN 12121]
MTFSPWRLALFALVAGLLLWAAFDWLTDQVDEAQRERDQARYERDGLREAARLSGELLAERDAIDRQRTQELTHERNQNLLLQRAVDAGHQRLLVKAACSTRGTTDPGAGGLADAGSAELTADARSDYFTLRDQLALSRQMILGLQGHVRVLQDYVRRACGR